MKTLALVFILMVAVCVAYVGRARRYRIPKKSQYVMKTWIIYYFDKQLDRFLKMTKDKFKLTHWGWWIDDIYFTTGKSAGFVRGLDAIREHCFRKDSVVPTEVNVLRYINRLHMVRNCRFYRDFATLYLRRRRRPLDEKNYAEMGRYIGHHVRMGWRYYRMVSKKKIPKMTKFMKEYLAKKPGDIFC